MMSIPTLINHGEVDSQMPSRFEHLFALLNEPASMLPDAAQEEMGQNSWHHVVLHHYLGQFQLKAEKIQSIRRVVN